MKPCASKTECFPGQWPNIDLDEVGPNEVRGALEMFMATTWRKCCVSFPVVPDSDTPLEDSWPADLIMPTVPYDKITNQPDIFYDTTAFAFPEPLQIPSQMSRKAVTLLSDFCNTEFGVHAANGRRFAFRAKQDIEKRLRQADKEEVRRLKRANNIGFRQVFLLLILSVYLY